MTTPNPHTGAPKKSRDALYCPRCDEEIADKVLPDVEGVVPHIVRASNEEVGWTQCFYCNAELSIRMDWTLTLERRP